MTTLYNLPAAAAILSVHPQTLKRWHKQGKITLVELPGGHWRVPASEVTRLAAGDDADDQPEAETQQ